MLVVLARNWWALALRGVIAIIFGLVIWVWSGLALTEDPLALLFGAYALVDGVFAIASIFLGGGRQGRWLSLLIEGIVGVLVGLVALVWWPDLAELALLYVIAAWAIVTGVFEIAAAIQLRREIENELLLGLSGLASVIFGLLLIIFPQSGALAIVWLIGVYSIVFGILLIALSFRLRGLAEQLRGDRPASV